MQAIRTEIRGRGAARWEAWLSLAGLAAVFAVLAARGWRRWPDVLVDFGPQLYVPWQLAVGKHLYSDIAWKFGPLSQYWNALLFRCFGISYTTLLAANLTLLAVLTLVLHAALGRLFGTLSALLGALTFLVVSGFSHLSWRGNWSFASPYTHEATHGLALALAAVAAAQAWALRRAGAGAAAGQSSEPAAGAGRPWLAAAGVLVGLAALTKVEIAAPAAAGVALLLALTGWRERAGWWRLVGDAAVAAGGALLPPLVALTGLAGAIGVRGAAAGLATNAGLAWAALVRQEPFYREVAGLSDPGGNLVELAWAALGWGAAIAAAIGLEAALGRWLRLAGRPRRWRWVAGIAAAAGGLAAGLLLPVSWDDLGRPLPVGAGVLLAWGVVRALSARDEVAAREARLLCLWATCALGLTAKVLLDARLSHYGFIHAAPALVLVLAFLLRRRPVGAALSGSVFRGAVAGLVVAGLWVHAAISDDHLAQKTFPLGEGGDTILAYPPDLDPTAAALAAAQHELRLRRTPHSTLLAVPEGAILNYQLRLPNPTPYTAFTPYDLATYGGEAAVVTALATHPPDFVALVSRSMHEYGAGNFGGQLYGRPILAWIDGNYEEVARLRPAGHPRIQIAILARGVGAATPRPGRDPAPDNRSRRR